MTSFIKGKTGDWEIVIGLEVHAQVIAESKLFSGAPTNFGADPNSQVSFVDAGMPGMLPVINNECVEQAVRTGLALNAKINNHSVFARKNYFYADLPQGYQISQFELPIVGEGTIILDMSDGSSREVGIERLHLEQDAGKSIHDLHPSRSFIDLNRSGIALMEVVSKPDMRSSEEAGAYLRKLRSIMRYIGTCDGNMDEGSMRCDANVSVRPVGSLELRTRCEIKNVNSIRYVMQAIDYEARRHVGVYEEQGEINQETRLYDQNKGETRAMRSKEFAHDYRYFPDPDLLPLQFDDNYVTEIRSTLPELPDDKKQRFIDDYELTPYDASVLVAERDIAVYYEKVVDGRDPKVAANWVISNLFGALNKTGLTINESPVSALSLGQLIDFIGDGTISGRLAKDVFEIMVETGKDPATIIDEKGLKQITDSGAIEAAIDSVMSDNLDKVEEYRSGKVKLIGWFVGQVMKQTQGKANPDAVNKLLRDKLST
ncbi:MAG: Asp-tRNA(Asn)/Glu-tRNA(Gln) amidotransferase GatCAB subunit B [Rhodospirillaceae bacterium]|nr:Asp-tRNA(Asn)/Glu-tRNA(Gln) amidotransferase GatCAB subunit B [Rhodospirillaceae bacterium]